MTTCNNISGGKERGVEMQETISVSKRGQTNEVYKEEGRELISIKSS